MRISIVKAGSRASNAVLSHIDMSTHLVVCTHGVWGTRAHFNYIVEQLLESNSKTMEFYQDDSTCIEDSLAELKSRQGDDVVVIYRTRGNEGYSTYDGIDVCGARLAEEAETLIALIENNSERKVDRISMAGYSLGGLMSRYAVGLLYTRGVFNRIPPASFTTFCTPHVGVRVLGESRLASAFNSLAGSLMGKTGKQLFLEDRVRVRETAMTDSNRERFSKPMPLLEVMSYPESSFSKGLEAFKHRNLYANVVNDSRTAWYTAGIYDFDPFKGVNMESVTLPTVEGTNEIIVDTSRLNNIKLQQADSSNLLAPPPEAIKQPPGWLERRFRWAKVLYNIAVTMPMYAVTWIASAIFYGIISNRRRVQYAKGEYWKTNTSDDFVGALVNGKVHSPDSKGSESSSSASHGHHRSHSLEEGAFRTALEDQVDKTMDSMFTAMEYKTTEGDTLDLTKTKLVLSDTQKTIIENLSQLKWDKTAIHIRATKQAHAGAIVRHPDPSFYEGKTVVKHWIDNKARL